MTNKLALIIAVVLGAIAIFGIHKYVERKQEEVTRGKRLVEFAVLKRDIEAGEELSPELVFADKFPERLLDSLQDAILHKDVNTFYRSKFTSRVKAGQIVLRSYFPMAGSAAQIELGPGERAVTVAVDIVSGLAGMIRPGNFVDVIGTYTLESKVISDYQVSTFICKKCLVLALDNFTATHGEPKRGGYRTVTLRVSTREAEWLTWTQEFGKLGLVLRNDTDSVEEGPEAVDGYDVFMKASKGKNLIGR